MALYKTNFLLYQLLNYYQNCDCRVRNFVKRFVIFIENNFSSLRSKNHIQWRPVYRSSSTLSNNFSVSYGGQIQGKFEEPERKYILQIWRGKPPIPIIFHFKCFSETGSQIFHPINH